MILRPLGQSGYELCCDGCRILIDPYLSHSVERLHGRPRLLPIPEVAASYDGIFCTHDHLDHLDPDTVVQFPPEQRFYTTREGCKTLESLGRFHHTALTEGQCVTVGPFTVTAVFAAHTVESFGLVVQAQGRTLYFSGDTLFDPRLFEVAVYRPDIVLICINGRLGNMDTQQALTTAVAIGAPVNIPNHYDMFASNSADPHAFADRIPGGRILPFDTACEVDSLL